MRIPAHRIPILLGVLILSVLFQARAQRPEPILVESEGLPFTGDWFERSDPRVSNQALMISLSGPEGAPAMGLFDVATDGEYRVWAHSLDYAETKPGTRRYQVVIDGEALPKEAGAHLQAGWRWEELGGIDLDAGEHLLMLRSVTSYGRSDAILFAPAGFDPSEMAVEELEPYRAAPRRLEIEGAAVAEAYAIPDVADEPVSIAARLTNDRVEVIFESRKDLEGADRIVRRVRLRDGQRWIEPAPFKAEKIFVLTAGDVGVGFDPLPGWTRKDKSLELGIGDQTVEIPFYTGDPFQAGDVTVLMPVSVDQTAPDRVEVRFATPAGGAVREAVGVYTLPEAGLDLVFELRITPSRDAFYSCGICAFGGRALEEVDYVQLPPLYQFQRVPDEAQMVTNIMTPHPLALVQAREDGADIASLVLAEPDRLPFEWPEGARPRYGFTLQNPEGRVQPGLFTPVLGLVDSRWQAGEEKTVAWRLIQKPGDWKEAIEYASGGPLQVRDYRKPLHGSLTDAVLNMIELTRQDEAGGWDPRYKGFYDIETPSMVKNASPLTIISMALLTRDEEYYRTRALPTIESTLSWRRANFIWTGITRKGQPAENQLTVPTEFYSTAYWAGVDVLLRRLNPWMEELMLRNGDVYHSDDFNSSPVWSEWLALYRRDPDPAYLEKTQALADEWIGKEVFGLQTEPVEYDAFSNISFYPYWWDLLELHEITQEPRYLEAAEESAFGTICTQWSHPLIPDRRVRIHEGGQVREDIKMYHRGGEPFRLGWPRQPNDTPEKMVPAWIVSGVGYSLENARTYFLTANCRKITASTWAPYLLRLYQQTGREIYRTYARNTIIGRFSNYPGYYVALYSDLYLKPDYPYTGPDITSIYYHHIPITLAFATDYLVTQARVRSNGAIDFPHSVQKNYAWFTNWVYGPQPGRVYGEGGAVLWLDRNLVELETDQVDWLTARSEDRFFLVLMSQVDHASRVRARLDTDRIGMRNDAEGRMKKPAEGTGLLVSGDVEMEAEQVEVEIPAKGLVALSFPAEERRQFPEMTPLHQGHYTRDAKSDEWEALHVFRIRGPYGSDSVFAVFPGEPGEGAHATFTLKGAEERTVKDTDLPFELSVYPVPTDGDVTVEVSATDSTGRTETFTVDVPARPGGEEF